MFSSDRISWLCPDWIPAGTLDELIWESDTMLIVVVVSIDDELKGMSASIINESRGFLPECIATTKLENNYAKICYVLDILVKEFLILNC